ncbi:unnamed protein product [Effrenium voratum]|uniref:Uncharacterized protein n=1 Tax=Effrenium voratum TaxID=2562239 RepID=A0AA36N0M8_9DINO|nr:unnamed protein product [Effrenium voratum]
MSISESDISVDWGRQRCRLTLVGQSLTLFDLNFGTTTVNFPAPIRAMVGVGKNVESCLSGNPSATDVFKCVAAAIGSEWIADVPAFQILFGLAEEVSSCSGNALEIFTCIAGKMGAAILETVSPFSILMQLGPMLSEFIAFFAELASALIHTLLSESTSLLQQAVEQTHFPKPGEKPLQLAGPKGLTAHVRRQKTRPSRSLLQREARQASGKPSNDVDNGIVGFGTTEAQPYASMLITQFAGDEFDTGSCLAFAPKHRTGAAGNVTQRDWQVPSMDSPDFVKLEPWAVPCDNQWAKDNPSKWEGYSFYTYESVIEKCAAITYSMSAQPVISFVGGLEFDLLPAPLMEVTTEVCWPDRVTAPDLSLIVFTARSAGIVLFTHTIRLHRRFGNNTNFTDGNFKDSVERPRNYFGKGTGDDDDKALQVLSRAALAQLNSTETPMQKTVSTPKTPAPAFSVTQEELFLASAKYDRKMGLNITSRFEGQAAVERVEAVLSKKMAALQEDANLASHELFELSSPSGSLVGFSVKGELAEGMLQLVVRINFGPVESPTKTIPLIDLVDNLRVVLAALPFVSQASKQKAIDAMSTTHFDLEMPVNEVLETLTLDTGAQLPGLRDAMVVRKNGICSVQAALAPSNWGQLTTLPPECRPSGTLVFKVPTQSAVAQVDITGQGVVSWMEGSQDSWLSLGGLVFPAAAPGWPLELVNGWSNFGGFSEAKYILVGSLCFLEGVIKGTNWNAMAQLPTHCLPTKRQMFNVNVQGGKNARVDVWPDGKVVYVGGDAGNWVSLSGVVFSTRQTEFSLSLAGGWVNNGGADDVYGTPTYSMAHGHCLLEGRIKGDLVSGGGLLAALPVECWPTSKLIFSKALNSGPIEVDVTEYGEVSYRTNTSSSGGTISLSGIIFSAPSDGKRFLPTAGAWFSDSGSFGDAALYMTGGFCLVEARLRGGHFAAESLLATLPEGCRPTKRLTFSVNHNKYPHRVDVTPSGSVLWMDGRDRYSWVSLTGIRFAPGELGQTKLAAENGWAGAADVTKRNGICCLEGLFLGGILTTSVAKLPGQCVPNRRLILNMITEDVTQRVDILTTGKLEWLGTAPPAANAPAGVPSVVQLTVSGILLVPDESHAVRLQLQTGWAHYGGDYGKAKYVLMDGICVIQGLIKDGSMGSVIAQLPEECRPKAERLIFNVNVQDFSARVDVRNNGEMIFKDAESWTVSWLSLSGISFAV